MARHLRSGGAELKNGTVEIKKTKIFEKGI